MGAHGEMNGQNEKKKVLCAGAAVLDILASPVAQKAPWQEKQRIERIQMQAGGDAVNQAVHLAALGLSPVLAACVGDDENGRAVKSVLENRGVDTTRVRVLSGVATGTSLVLVDESGERHTPFKARGLCP